MGVFNLTALGGNEPVQEANTEPQVADDALDNAPVTVAVKETDESKEMMITLDGPLSRIYTKALNLAYARESISMMTPEALTINKAQQRAEDESTYVYAIDTTQMDMAKLVASTEHFRVALETGNYKNVIVALESDGNVTSKAQLFAQMAQSLGAKVCYSRNSAMRAILDHKAGG